MTKVLVVDGERHTPPLHQEWLERDGYEVYSATDGREALRLFGEHRPTLSITGLRMPGMHGFQLIKRIREMSDVPVLVLTSLTNEEYMVRGLEMGADEYIVKPVSEEVFLARVGSLLRRVTPVDEVPSVYSDAFLTMSFSTHEVIVRGQSIHLTPTEFRLLGYLVRQSHRVVTHEELLSDVWGDRSGSLESLKWYVSSLRGKLAGGREKDRFIVAVPRVGYRYYPPDSQDVQPDGVE